MKNILCVVSANAGHIDLGGSGFINLAKALSINGHRVSWLTRAGQVERLKNMQQEVFDEESIPYLWIYGEVLNAKNDAFRLNTICDSLANFYNKLKTLRPDIILLDRVMSLGAIAANQLDIPYVSMGAPGGYWSNERGYIEPSIAPVPTYKELEQLICDKLNWNPTNGGSFWLDSPHLNVCFTGRSFYSSSGVSDKTAFVNNFTVTKPQTKRKGIGVSFGNTGSIDLMMHVLSSLYLTPESYDGKIDIYAGRRPGLEHQLKQNTRPGTRIYGWKDFSDQLNSYNCFIFMGGIGTIWHCINQNVPMCVAPAHMTDQLLNAKLVKNAELGEALVLKHPDTKSVCSTIDNFINPSLYCSGIERFKKENNFSDTIDTVCEKIENIAR